MIIKECHCKFNINSAVESVQGTHNREQPAMLELLRNGIFPLFQAKNHRSNCTHVRSVFQKVKLHNFILQDKSKLA